MVDSINQNPIYQYNVSGADDSISTRGEFAEAVLIGIGAEPTPENIQAMLAWMEGENTRAANNPLATTLSTYDNQGATYFNTFGDQGQYHVRNYATPEQGVDATVSTLQLGYYDDIVAALQRGTTVTELERLVTSAPWGTETFGTGSLNSYNTELGTQSVPAINQNPTYQYNVSTNVASNSSNLVTVNGVTASQADWDALAALTLEQQEALRQFVASSTEEEQANLARMAAGGNYYYDGVDVIDTPYTPLVPDNSLELQRQEDAWAIARGILDDMGLGSLYGKVQNWIMDGRSAETAIALIRFEPEFKARFRGMDERLANGYNAISPERYLELEDNYRNMLEQAGFPADFIQDFHEFIANDVNETEFGDRISVAMRAAEAADPVILEELKTRYGIGIDTKADITMYFLDPERAVTLLEARTQLGVAELSAATTGAVGGRLEEQTGRQLFQGGYVSREVAERLKGQGSLRQRMVGEGTTNTRTGPLSSTALAAAEFGLDSDAVARVKMLRSRRAQRGLLESGAAITASGITGFSVAS